MYIHQDVVYVLQEHLTVNLLCVLSISYQHLSPRVHHRVRFVNLVKLWESINTNNSLNPSGKIIEKVCELRELMGYWKEERKAEIICVRYWLLDYPFVFPVTVMVKTLLFLFVGVSHQSMPMVSPWWARLLQRRSSWWVSALQVEKSSGSLRKSSESQSQRSTRWNRFTSSVRRKILKICKIYVNKYWSTCVRLTELSLSHAVGELERQQGIQPHGLHTNGGQMDAHTGHGSPSGAGFACAA